MTIIYEIEKKTLGTLNLKLLSDLLNFINEKAEERFEFNFEKEIQRTIRKNEEINERRWIFKLSTNREDLIKNIDVQARKRICESAERAELLKLHQIWVRTLNLGEGIHKEDLERFLTYAKIYNYPMEQEEIREKLFHSNESTISTT